MALVKTLKDHRAVTVRLENRTFVVYLDSADEAVRIVERKKFKNPYGGGYYNAVYWSAKHHALGKGDTMPKRIIAAANATP